MFGQKADRPAAPDLFRRRPLRRPPTRPAARVTASEGVGVVVRGSSKLMGNFEKREKLLDSNKGIGN